MTKDEIYKSIQLLLQETQNRYIPETKEGLLIRREEGDYIIKVTKKKQ